MTVTTNAPAPGTGGEPPAVPEGYVSLTVDGIATIAPKGELIIRVAERLGVAIPRFCDHPLLDPVGACRQCLVEVEGQRKPMASCTTTVTDGMVVKTQHASAVADKAQRGVMELLLINHPLDCPVCDKGGECPLQNQALSNGRGETRFEGKKRTFAKPINLSTQVLLDRERCVQCARCTRFSEQVAGDPFIDLIERGADQQVGISVAGDQEFSSYFSGNTVQICPVGALTGAAYRFRARPFDLVSTPSACEHCAAGCALRTDHRRGKVLRRLAGEDPEVNEEWNCDKGRWAFQYATANDRIRVPLVRRDGELVPASWPEALDAAANGLRAARGSAGVLVGGRSTLEDAYAYAKFARIALDSNDIDFRARPHSNEEAEFLAAHVAGNSPVSGGETTVTYANLDKAPAVLLVGFEPEDESPIVFLRLRKAVRKARTAVVAIAPVETRGLRKLNGTLLKAAPHTEPEFLTALAAGTEVAGLDAAGLRTARLLREPGAVILVGERLACVPGALSAALRLAEATGAKLAWIPRRAGERGAIEAGAVYNLLPGGRPAEDSRARSEVATAWGVRTLPTLDGRDGDTILEAVRAGSIKALLIGGVDPADLPDPAGALAALDAVDFLVSLEQRRSAVTERADVVLPVAVVAEKSGTFLDWEGRPRTFETALSADAVQTVIAGGMPDLRVLDGLADAMDVHLGLPDVAAARRELARIGRWDGIPAPRPYAQPRPLPAPAAGQAVLATHHLLLDDGRLQDGEKHLAGTARQPVVRLSQATAAEIGAADGDAVAVSTDAGTITLPLAVDTLPDRVVWLPTNSPGSHVRAALGADTGAVVSVARVAVSGDDAAFDAGAGRDLDQPTEVEG
ncbi:MAG TPA: NADH-quinone oxidoreductase subunit G [Actinocrinis sp.]|uniref:NADH-quinone oxidoreductase subunit G n=1 Tax=Actinocrinis sp. TaxID=1920516 RepID=UPI002DDD487D|nr:NADH-quinone oxidoreductase subunit G [Actinocrinis sp.]HEV2346802.1 NADH-quinone oxidoreductase subunit G [Actinocrinis sp.]